MSFEPKMYTLKVNIRAQEEREKREKERQLSDAISKIQSTNGPPAKPRKRKGLIFHQPGTFIAQGEQLRKRAKVEALQKRIAERAAKTGIANAAKLASLITCTKSSENKAKVSRSIVTKQEATNQISTDETVPDVEWWDKPILGKQTLDEVVPKLTQESVDLTSIFHGITNLIEHPPKPPSRDTSDIQVPIFLTKQERKKLRRQNRRNQELEKQEKIKLGLLPKPEPKLKRSNIMYALGDEAITNPSLAEAIVKSQQDKRLQAHIEHNESKKLTPEEKWAKKLRKVQEDLCITGIWVSVFRLPKSAKHSHRLKIISKNAKQLTMTGVIVLNKNINLVVVEGGPKQQRKFKHLIMDRIKWLEDPMTNSKIQPSDSNNIDKSIDQLNLCTLVWEGEVNKRAFRHIKIQRFEREEEARKHFRDLDVEHYWDLAVKMSILESIDNI